MVYVSFSSEVRKPVSRLAQTLEISRREGEKKDMNFGRKLLLWVLWRLEYVAFFSPHIIEGWISDILRMVRLPEIVGVA